MDFITPPSCVLPIPQRAFKEGSTFKFPPLDGVKTIPELFDWHFVENADHPVFVFKHAATNELKHLYYRDFVPAIHEAGWFVARAAGISLDDPSSTPDPVAIIATTGQFLSFQYLSPEISDVKYRRHDYLLLYYRRPVESRYSHCSHRTSKFCRSGCPSPGRNTF